ncbi:uncharacterized protein LOC121244182 [Juglans microcarpa x Juglans regia]|uniref:uncharacterized protein LOC121244182 n=1 Tax=Juglans microcarpa x Juglans regia TaxID=2249226 RepID=UPI001B7EBAB3|nr:uncharacterized protein LOC121244182 [Juglans microcarpa x Juglans regia]
MKTLSWNLRGLGNPRSIRTFRDLITREVPDILFLQETRMKSQQLEFCKLKLGFRNCFGVDSVGRSGGLALLWKDEINVSIVNFSNNHVHAIVVNDDGGKWLLTGVYGHPDSNLRCEVWSLLKALGRGVNSPWLVFGDFNEILTNFEKYGGNLRCENQMREFREVLACCELRDLGYVGPCYTWSNRRERRKGRRLLRFEAIWVGEKECSSIIEKVWQQVEGSASLICVIEGISACAIDLGKWNQNSFGHVQKELTSANRRLKFLQESDPYLTILHEHSKAREEVQKWLQRDELMWKQRSRVLWLREGDSNSKFFHSKASTRRRRNNIVQLQDDSGNWFKGAETDRLITNYFSSLFSTAEQVDLGEIVSGIEAKVTAEMNVDLLKPYVAEEVALALKQMHPSKAPGPDGMSPVFFQKYWPIIGKSVTNSVLLALNTREFPRRLNHTFITLIPKKTSPSKVANFRPISLCNVLYKLLSKVITNRLKKVLPDVISDSQCAFVPGRQISDNVLIAYELLHFLRYKRIGRKGFMSHKLDMSKAYDRVEWVFLKKMMEALGFASGLIHIVMKCVCTVSFSVLVNGSPKGYIIPSRGIRQGDPLSPYLFLLCTEGLISLLKRTVGRELQVFDVSNKKIHRVVSWNPPPIGFLKLNVDEAMFGDQNSAGVGVILRDHNGDVVVACSKSERKVSYAEFIEAIALLRGLQLCAQWGVPKVLLETDCLILVHALNDMAEFLTNFNFISQDIRRLMRGF